MKVRFTEEIWKEGNLYVSYCPELDIASCGEDVQQAKKNLYETIVINFEETQKTGTFKEFLEKYCIESTEENILSARKELVGFTPIEIPVP
jgi:predicted RNase H-like HicB family nuclease